MVQTEDLGKIFEYAICLLFGIPYDGVFKYNIEESIKIKQLLNKLKLFIEGPIKHIAGKGNKFDYHIITNDTYLSAKTSKRCIGKVAPQVIGQASKKTFCQYFKLDSSFNSDQLKQYIQDNIKHILHIYSLNTFHCPIVYYNKYTNVILYLYIIKQIDWEIYTILFTHIIKQKKWNESSTIKINNITIGEFQFHNHRDCIKFRWSFENILNMFKGHFDIITLY